MSPCTRRRRPSGVTSIQLMPVMAIGCGSGSPFGNSVGGAAAGAASLRDTRCQIFSAASTSPAKANGAASSNAPRGGGGIQPAGVAMNTANSASAAKVPASAAIRGAPASKAASGAATSSTIRGEAPPPVSTTAISAQTSQAITTSPRRSVSPAPATAKPVRPGMRVKIIAKVRLARGAPPMPPDTAAVSPSAIHAR